ncbi:MAG: flagellar hook-length control protein FliK [Acetatifactor sp.]|nr:flagellar hook-length control protein FliK [Acetatifactor sp.]
MKLRMPWGIVDQSGTTAGSKRANSSAQTSRPATGDSTASLNRQIRSLVPGQTIRGEVVARNGSDVQLKLSDDMIMHAKVDPNMNLEIGKNMTFEVRNNGSALTLSPLFENMSADVNVLKALDMAGLPVNETSVTMTKQLMEAGLSVDRNSLQQIYREVMSYPQAEISDVVNLHKLGLPVNEANVNQMISYRNLTHQLLDGMESVLGALPDAMEGMAQEGNLQGLTGLYQELFDLIQEGAVEELALTSEETLPETAELTQEQAVPGQMAEAEMNQQEAALLDMEASVGNTPAAAAEILLEELGGKGEGVTSGGEAEAGAAQAETGAVQTGDSAGTIAAEALQEETISAASRQMLSEQLLSMLSGLPMESQEAEQLAMQLRQFGQGQLSTEDFFATAGRMLHAARTMEDGIQNLHRIFSGEEFRNLLTESLKHLWTVRPEELAKSGKVEELYQRMDRQLRGLANALETGGQAESTAFRATTAMSQNIDFLNQLNQMYAYVQLPLHLSQGDAHGELYVYANKKSLADNGGKISALLHLDMEHLGPVDVYVMLEHSKVNTRFYVQDEEMLDFLAAHMHILTERLAERGYDCSFSMTARGEEQDQTANSGIRPILDQEKGVLVTQYAFDVRT